MAATPLQLQRPKKALEWQAVEAVRLYGEMVACARVSQLSALALEERSIHKKSTCSAQCTTVNHFKVFSFVENSCYITKHHSFQDQLINFPNKKGHPSHARSLLYRVSSWCVERKRVLPVPCWVSVVLKAAISDSKVLVCTQRELDGKDLL